MSTPENITTISDDDNISTAAKLEQAEERIRRLESMISSLRVASTSSTTDHASVRDAGLTCATERPDDASERNSNFEIDRNLTVNPEKIKPAAESELLNRYMELAGLNCGVHTSAETRTLNRPPKSSDSLAPGLPSFTGNSVGFLPRRDLVTFEGDPARYWLFMRCFEANVLKTTSDPTVRLSYLIQYCTGEAKQAIESCLILEPEEGLSEALNILQRRFGRPHMIARKHIDALTDGAAVKPNDFVGLSRLAGELRTCYTTLRQLNYESDLNASRTIGAIVKRLPDQMQFRWAKHIAKFIRTRCEPKFVDLIEFVEEEADVVDTYLSFASLPTTGTSTAMDKRNDFKSRGPSAYIHATSAADRRYLTCLCCGDQHYLDQCGRFRQLDIQARTKLCRDKELCFLCLKSNHNHSLCRSRKNCGLNQCKAPHHPLLHVHPVDRSPNPKDTEAVCFTLKHTDGRCVSLGLVSVLVSGPRGQVETVALLDNGSDTSLIDTELLGEIGVKGRTETLNINTMTGRGSFESQRSDVTVHALGGEESIQLQGIRSVRQFPDIGRDRQKRVKLGYWEHLADLRLPEAGGKVRMIIGSDNPYTHWALEQRRGRPNDPYAVRTPLGWIVLGPTTPTGRSEVANQEMTTVSTASMNSISCDNIDLHQTLELMYDREFNEVPSCRLAMSLSDKYALARMEDSLRKMEHRYEVALPWRTDRPRLPDNRQLAQIRLEALKRRLSRDPHLRTAYTMVLNDYLSKGYAERIPEDEVATKGEVWYIPHHAVCHPRKPGKVRVVFDCQAVHHETSLNKQLLSGPDLTNNLVGVLLRFRLNPVAVTSDIEAMFHQIEVPVRDRNCLRFLWWENGEVATSPSTFRMTVHPFGATSSPSCANLALRQSITDSSDRFQKQVIDFVRECFYVDDCLFSVDTTSEAAKLVDQLRTITSQGGFHLTKWISNEYCVLETLPETELRTSDLQHRLQSGCTESALGVVWDVSKDKIRFDVKAFDGDPTRRKILSFVASVYDPLGILSPLLLEPKILLQDFVRKKADWDAPLSVEDSDRWVRWLSEMKELSSVSVCRCLKPVGFKRSSLQLHCFSDASESAYGAALYLRCTDDRDNVRCSLILGKSRVTPIRTVSIPRLELTAAVLSTRLATLVMEELRLECSVTFWTDSMIVLQLLRCVDRRFPTYVANRISIIHQNSHPNQWRYVTSKENSADLASRGLRIKKTKDLRRWIDGPEFLMYPETMWPQAPASLGELPIELSKVESGQVLQVVSERCWSQKFEGCPTWTALQRRIVILLRFKTYCISRFLHKHATNLSCDIKVSDVREATENLIRLVQKEAFSEEIEILENKGTKKGRRQLKLKSSKLRKLSPFLCDGIIRVGGRLTYLPVSFDTKHPILMPNKHHVTRMLIMHHHIVNAHAGTQHTLCDIQRKYWIVGGTAAVRRVLAGCATCKIRYARPMQQLMAPVIPDQFTVFQPAFTAVGVDYFGPMIVNRGRIREKRYGCLFTCLSTRAVHIEVSHLLDTDSFLCAFSRFAARRGWPSKVYSDNGQNFHGAETELKSLLIAWNQDKIIKTTVGKDCDWIFNPPCASHRGGLWERLIRSIRTLLGGILNNQIVNDEVLLTSLIEVERILNERPLTALSESPDPYATISPRELLMISTTHQPETENVSLPLKLSRRWRQVQHLSDTFWRKWILVYLPTLQKRQKWLDKHRNLRKGDLVLVCDVRTSKGLWPKGIVEEVVISADGVVRQASVRTNKGTLRRDVRQLCLLEADLEEEPNTQAGTTSIAGGV